MTKALTPTPKFTVYNNGIPANGAKVYVYAAGTTTPADSYSDEAGTPNTNPVICDSRGECDVWLTPGTSYKFVVKDSADVTIYTVDDISGGSGGGGGLFTSLTVTGDVTVSGGSVTFTIDTGETFTVTGAGSTIFQTDVVMDGNSTTFINGATIDLPDSTVTFNDLDSSLQTLINAGLSAGGATAVVGFRGKNDATFPDNIYEFTECSIVILVDPATDELTVVTAPALKSINIDTAGPAINGRDQAGAFSANSWVYFWYISNADGSLIAGLASASPTAPTLPSGYTRRAFATAVALDGTSDLNEIVTIGHNAYAGGLLTFGSGVGSLIANGTATSFTLVDASAVVPDPAVCPKFTMNSGMGVVSSGGAVGMTMQFKGGDNNTAGSSNTFALGGVSGTVTLTFGAFSMPNIDQQIYYAGSLTQGTSFVINSGVIGYDLLNGG